MKTVFVIFLLVAASFKVSGQSENLMSLEPPAELDNIHIHKLHSDSLSTYFVIWVKNNVRSHKHAFHSESIYVLEGKGKMRIGDKTMEIKPGDFFNIPENTVHSLTVTSKVPVKVISIQAPYFDGSDRVFVP